jgi:hypothetical protein
MHGTPLLLVLQLLQMTPAAVVEPLQVQLANGSSCCWLWRLLLLLLPIVSPVAAGCDGCY